MNNAFKDFGQITYLCVIDPSLDNTEIDRWLNTVSPTGERWFSWVMFGDRKSHLSGEEEWNTFQSLFPDRIISTDYRLTIPGRLPFFKATPPAAPASDIWERRDAWIESLAGCVQ